MFSACSPKNASDSILDITQNIIHYTEALSNELLVIKAFLLLFAIAPSPLVLHFSSMKHP